MTKKAIIIASIVLAVVATQSFAVPTTIQNGVAGYSQNYSEALTAGGWGAPGHSASGSIGAGVGVVNSGGAFIGHVLTKFENIQNFIPAGHTVVNSAILEVNVNWDFQTAGTSANWARALQPWNDLAQDATGTYWLNYGNGGNNAGFVGPTTNFPVNAPGTGPFQIVLDTSMVEDWIANPGTNYGIMLRDIAPSGSQPHWFFDDENTGIAPKLILDTDVPEPATMALLGLGGLMVLRRRKSA